MLRIDQLTKRFGRQYALDQVSATLEAGQAVSLIGPNGSGKTTLIKCVLGLVRPDSGTLSLRGEDLRLGWEYRRHIGYMPQTGRFPDHMRVGQLLDMLREVRRSTCDRLDEDLIGAFQIARFAHKPMRTLSGGMRQKVSASIAFLFDPAVLILDEPTAGLDPPAAEILKEKVLAEKAKGKLILMTSHLLSDLEELTTEVMYLHEGQLRLFLPVGQLKSETGESTLQRAVARIMRDSLNAAAA
ncbi:MAG: ABC transporter ATP-binding protein [Bacteroidia bacterium]|nr:ABC transporter ATP-binding protein [Bacteroidia bacterium]